MTDTTKPTATKAPAKRAPAKHVATPNTKSTTASAKTPAKTTTARKSTQRPMKSKKQGRPTLLSPVRMARFLGSVALGNYIEPSAKLVNLSVKTISNWRVRGEQSLIAAEQQHPEIMEKISDWIDKYPANYEKSNPKWTAKGLPEFDEDDWPFVLFFTSLENARAMAEIKAVQEIRTAGKKSWQANAWWLERVHYQRYGRRERIEHTGVQGGAPIGIEVSVDSLEAKIAEITGASTDA